jgi:hypothetical protein
MKREDAVSLLREIMVACPSFVTASSVSIIEEREGWGLNVAWTPDILDGDCLEKIATDRSLGVTTSNGRTILRSSQKQS